MNNVRIDDAVQLGRPRLEEVKLVVDEDAVDQPPRHGATPQPLPVARLVPEVPVPGGGGDAAVRAEVAVAAGARGGGGGGQVGALDEAAAAVTDGSEGMYLYNARLFCCFGRIYILWYNINQVSCMFVDGGQQT